VILLWGVEDEPLRLVRRSLEELGTPFVFLNQADLLHVHLELEYAPRPAGVIDIAGAACSVEAFRSVYVRPHDFRDLAAFADRDRASAAWQHARDVQHLLWNYVDVADALVLNRPSAMLSNGSKPYQSGLIERYGFAVPETLLTTDPEAVRAFRAVHGDVIYKSISGTRSIVTRLTDAHDARLDLVQWCPTQFQRFVDGIDYRVHVVGSRVFAARIRSDAVDYRYGASSIEACTLPDDVSDRCLRLAAALDLGLAGIDLRRDAEGRWFCFEVNPAPGYSSFEVAGQRIGLAIAALLATA
jgi:glutathione synthase/RimK-type ligase-like ATP-grasp enzyme